MLLYLDTKRAPNPRKMRVYLAEKGLQLPIKELDLRAGEQRTPEFRQKNPFAADSRIRRRHRDRRIARHH